MSERSGVCLSWRPGGVPVKIEPASCWVPCDGKCGRLVAMDDATRKTKRVKGKALCVVCGDSNATRRRKRQEAGGL